MDGFVRVEFNWQFVSIGSGREGNRMKRRVTVALAVLACLLPAAVAALQPELEPGSPELISPEDLFNLLQNQKADKPVILNVGPHLIYMQAHIPGAEYIGAASDSQG